MTKDTVIGFTYKPNIVVLNLDEQKFYWNNHTEKSSEIFSKLDKGFDFYFMDNILMIPDPSFSKSNVKYYCFTDGLNFEACGKFIAFFHIATRKNDVLIADNLTFPEYCYLKENFRIIRR